MSYVHKTLTRLMHIQNMLFMLAVLYLFLCILYLVFECLQIFAYLRKDLILFYDQHNEYLVWDEQTSHK